MAFGLIGLVGIVVALLVLVGIVAALARGLRSPREGSEGGGGIGVGVVLVAVLVFVLAGGGMLLFGVARSVSIASSPLTAPSPGSITVHVQCVDLEPDAIARAIESALAEAVSEDCTHRLSHGQVHGAGLGAPAGSATRTYVLEDAREGSNAGFPQDALDFEALCDEYEFALLGLVPEGTRPEDLSIVLGYCSMDDGTVRAAEVAWIDDAPRIVPADPDATFPGGPSWATQMQGMDGMQPMQPMPDMPGALDDATGEPSTVDPSTVDPSTVDPSAAAGQPSVPASPDSPR
ncbi:hypothetical protein Pla163_12760 [Planctomycetes bacterium Pla163]|uniref:Uncharacterized protein n=1 Tax=Rohdeia mirabilis TaxID=2528008 RepID=A0A518CY62_9BACT|nr:hypothetical protein Pla163_12760 [Planctomycetes bacterium Pla163]